MTATGATSASAQGYRAPGLTSSGDSAMTGLRATDPDISNFVTHPEQLGPVRSNAGSSTETSQGRNRRSDEWINRSRQLPDQVDLAIELRRLREKGLLRARSLELPALEAVARVID